MEENEIKRIIQISVGGVCLIAILGILYTGADPFTFSTIRLVSGGLTFMTLFWSVFFRWGWHWWLLEYIFMKPNLNGTWIGTLTSDWRDSNGNTVGPRKFAIVVRQTFLTIHITTFTDTFVARSYAESLILQDDRGVKTLIYLYAQDTTLPGEANNREGATELRVIENSPLEMRGRFWTSTKTNGIIHVRFTSRKCASDFTSAVALSDNQ